MKNQLITIERDHLTTTCGGTVATSPWTTFQSDLKSRIDGELASARSRFDNYKSTIPTAPTAPTMPTVPSTKRTNCFPGTYRKV
jgi:hypothetical protein